MIKYILSAAVLCLLTVSAQAADRPTGEIVIATAHDKWAYVFINGNAALSLFHSMQVPTKDEKNQNQFGKVSPDGRTYCYKAKDKEVAQCMLGINPSTGDIYNPYH